MRQKRIVAQSCFLAKVKHMKLAGQKQEVMQGIDNWLESYLPNKIARSGTLKVDIARTQTSKFISTERQYYKLAKMKEQLV